MAQRDDLTWWAHNALAGWQELPGPRYLRIASALVHAVERRQLSAGVRVPAERELARALGVSRGTVVAALEQAVTAGVVVRRQGHGTFVVGPSPWARHLDDDVARRLLRDAGGDIETIDLSLSVPPGTDHLPAINGHDLETRGHGLDARGIPELRAAIAKHLSENHHLPTDPEQVLVTSGSRQALRLLAQILVSPSTRVVAGCPVHPGAVASLLRGENVVSVAVPVDGAGLAPDAVARAVRGARHSVVYVMPTGHDPTGAVMSSARRRGLLDALGSGRVTIVEDLSQADLVLDCEEAATPLAAGNADVVAVGSLSKVLWAGLRIGWIRADRALIDDLTAAKIAADVATSAPSQLLAARLLEACRGAWFEQHRQALVTRRDYLLELLGASLPSWRIRRPAAGLSLFAELPVDDASAFVHTAARLGVLLRSGRGLCSDGKHYGAVRLSFAETLSTLDVAVERLLWAWERHGQDRAASP